MNHKQNKQSHSHKEQNKPKKTISSPNGGIPQDEKNQKALDQVQVGKAMLWKCSITGVNQLVQIKCKPYKHFHRYFVTTDKGEIPLNELHGEWTEQDLFPYYSRIENRGELAKLMAKCSELKEKHRNRK